MSIIVCGKRTIFLFIYYYYYSLLGGLKTHVNYWWELPLWIYVFVKPKLWKSSDFEHLCAFLFKMQKLKINPFHESCKFNFKNIAKKIWNRRNNGVRGVGFYRNFKHFTSRKKENLCSFPKCVYCVFNYSWGDEFYLGSLILKMHRWLVLIP